MEEKLKYVHDNPEVYFTQKAKDGGYICPVCGNGSGRSGTGVKLIKGQTFRYKCFKCGTSGDVINFYAAERHISNAEALQGYLPYMDSERRVRGKYDALRGI